MAFTTLPSPSHGVIGASSLGATVSFFEAFGFRLAARDALPLMASAALYGVHGRLEEAVLVKDGAASGWLRVVQTPEFRSISDPMESRPLWPKVYTRSLEASLSVARGIAAYTTPIRSLESSGLGHLVQAAAIGPDFLPLGIVESTRRRPSLLDVDHDVLHSEIVFAPWSVRDLDREVSLWRGHLVTVFEGNVDGTAVPDYFVPEHLLIPLAQLGGSEDRPIAIELLDLGGPRHYPPLHPLRPGLHSVALSVGDAASTAAALPFLVWGAPVELDTSVHPDAKAIAGQTPGGIRLELWQQQQGREPTGL